MRRRYYPCPLATLRNVTVDTCILMIAGMMIVVTLTRRSLRFSEPQTKDLAKTGGCDKSR